VEMTNRIDELLTVTIQLALVLARLTLWLGIFAVILWGIFTVPVITLSGCLVAYVLWHHVRHTSV